MNRPYTMPEPPATEQALSLAKQLVRAVHERDEPLVVDLLESGADPLLNTTGNAAGAAVDVAMIKFLPALERMIRATRILNSLDEKGASLLHRAAVVASPDAILCLAKAGLWLDVKDAQGMTPLHLSAEAGGNGTMTQAGPAIARNVCCLLALGAAPISPDWLESMRHSIKAMSYQDIRAAHQGRGPLSNAARSLSPAVVEHVMVSRLHEITDDDYVSAKAWIEERAANYQPLSMDIEPLFQGFFQALKARDVIAQVRQASTQTPR